MWSENRLWKELAKKFGRLLERPWNPARFYKKGFCFYGLCSGIDAAFELDLISEDTRNDASSKLEEFRISAGKSKGSHFWPHTKAGHTSRVRFCLRQAKLCDKLSKKG